MGVVTIVTPLTRLIPLTRLTIFAVLLIRTLTLLLALHPLLLALLSSLIHGIQNAKIMLGMLKIGFSKNTVTRSRCIPPELKIFFEKLLRRTTDAEIGTVAIKYMVAV